MQSDLREAIAGLKEVRIMANECVETAGIEATLSASWVRAMMDGAIAALQSLGDSPDSGVRDPIGVEAIRESFIENGNIDVRVAALVGEIYRLRGLVLEGAGSPKGSDGDLRPGADCEDCKTHPTGDYCPEHYAQARKIADKMDGTPVEAPGDSLRESEGPAPTLAEMLAACPVLAALTETHDAAFCSFCLAMAPKAESSTPRSEAEGSQSPPLPPSPSLVEAARAMVESMVWVKEATGNFAKERKAWDALRAALSSLPAPQAAGREWLVTGINIGTGQWSVEGPPIGPNKFRVREVVESPAPEKGEARV